MLSSVLTREDTATAWLELHQELRNHPKVIRLAKAMDVSTAEATGTLVLLWLWAIQYARDGDLTKFSGAEIQLACLSQNPDCELHLVDSGWIDLQDGKKRLHDWEHYGIKFLEKQKKRMRENRKEQAVEREILAIGQKVFNLDHVGAIYLEMYCRKHNGTTPKVFHSEEFIKVWRRWYDYRQDDKRKKLTSSMMQEQLEWLSRQENPVECIRASIRNGWQGLFTEKSSGKSSFRANRAGGATTADDLRDTFHTETTHYR